MRDHPGLASCAVHCRYCGIRFLTHPRNAYRRDLYCPFGCREHRRRQQANERSKKHYRTDEGRWNKKLLNAKRSQVNGKTEETAPALVVLADAATANASRTDEAATSSSAAATSYGAISSSGQPVQPAGEAKPALAKPPGELAEAPRGQHFADDSRSRDQDVTLSLDGFVLDESSLVNSSLLPYLAMVASLIERRAIRYEELRQILLQSMRQRSFDRLPRREYVLRFLNRHPP